MKSNEQRGIWPWEQRRRRHGMRALILLVLLVLSVAYAFTFYGYVRSYTLQPDGHSPLASEGGRSALLAIARAVPGRMFAPLRKESTPRLHLEIEPRQLERIIAKREQALRDRILITSGDDFVRATLRHRDRVMRVRVRLKGDLTDHLVGDKWSFRVEMRDGRSVFGMRRFSLQAPHTRSYQLEPVFLDYLRKHDVLAPRYFFVDLTVNRRHIGRMALEEHFSSELLESQSRREGVVLRFDEQYLYQAERAFMDLVSDYDNWRNVPLDAFRRRKLERSPLLREQVGIAAGLLRGIADDTLEPSNALDARTWGRFLAACEIWSMPHMTHWNNLRFYLNPLTLRLEPVGFDASGASQEPPGLRCMGGVHMMMTRIMDDPKIRMAFLTSLREMSREVESDEFARWLRERETHYLPALRAEFPWRAPISLDHLRRRVQVLEDVNEETWEWNMALAPPRRMPHRPGAPYPILVHAGVVRDGSAASVELANAISLPITVTEIWLEEPHPRDPSQPPSRRTQSVYEPLPGTPWPEKPRRTSLTIPWRLPPGEGWTIGGTALLGDVAHEFRAGPGWPTLAAAPLPSISLLEVLAQHPYLEEGGTDGWLHVGPGVVDVQGALVLPEGTGLRVLANTTLRFGGSGMLVVRGPLEMLGSRAAPIVLEPRGKAWRGVVVLGDQTPVHASHVVFRETAAPQLPGWGVTGGVTFQRTDVRLENCVFEGSHAEDALNLVRSQMSLVGIEFKNSASDALDADFCDGKIEGGTIVDAGGDGVDVSGSRIEVSGVSFRDIRDKALSVGEGSEAAIRDVHVKSSGTGVASKDGSVVIVEGARFTAIDHAALMAYQKKSEFGPAELRASGVQIDRAGRDALVQLGSRLELEGEEVTPEAIDVDALYAEGWMRK